MYVRRGTYYLVINGKWINIGKDRETALRAMQNYPITTLYAENDIVRYVAKKVAVARGNAKKRRGIPFSITKDDVVALVVAQRFRCAVTGVRFSLDTLGPHKDRPFAPSIDRVDSDQGYVPGNCRIVCVATNFAMNRWGEQVLNVLLAGRRASIRQTAAEVDSETASD